MQPGSGDVLQFLKSGIMEIPDVLVVTKADLGQIAMRTRRDVSAALRSLGSPTTRVAGGLLAAAAAGHRRADRGARRAPRERSTSPSGACARGARTRSPTSRTSTASAGLRALGGRAAAERLLAEQDPALDTAALVTALERTPSVEPARPLRGGERAARREQARPRVDLLIIFGAFVLASALAGALGAANLGTALSFGQIALALTVVYVLLRR